MGNGSPFSASDPFLSSVHSSPRWRAEMSSELGWFSKDKMWERLIWHTWTQQEASLTSPLQTLAPLFSSAMAFAQFAQTSKTETQQNPNPVDNWEEHLPQLPPPPFSLVSLPLHPPSWTLRCSVKSQNHPEILRRSHAASDLTAFLALLRLPQSWATNTAWMV